jgi:hypothetical protein
MFTRKLGKPTLLHFLAPISQTFTYTISIFVSTASQSPECLTLIACEYKTTCEPLITGIPGAHLKI